MIHTDNTRYASTQCASFQAILFIAITCSKEFFHLRQSCTLPIIFLQNWVKTVIDSLAQRRPFDLLVSPWWFFLVMAPNVNPLRLGQA